MLTYVNANGGPAFKRMQTPPNFQSRSPDDYEQAIGSVLAEVHEHTFTTGSLAPIVHHMKSKLMNADEHKHASGKREITRRECFTAFGAVTGSLALGSPVLETVAYAEPAGPTVGLALRINGREYRLQVDPRTTLLDLLRERLDLTGSKKGCDHGQCGACTVLANGRRINSCLTLAVTHDGDEITTIEGLTQGSGLHPVQAAFIEHDGFQCGYCTSGQICSAIAMLEELRRGDASVVTADLSRIRPLILTDDEIRERMSGNICRCGAYPGIVAAVKSCAASTETP